MSSPPNPFASPSGSSGPAPDNPYAPCPTCGERNAKAAGFTWWGGLLGPKMLTHVICQNCFQGFNGKTGKSNGTAIAIYFTVALGISIAVGVGIFMISNH